MENLCRWEKTLKGYITLCGHVPKVMGRSWQYCPYCGKELDKQRAEYLHAYYMNHNRARG